MAATLYGFGIAVDSSGYAYVAGSANSSNFPTTGGAFQTSLAGKRNAFVSKLNPRGSSLVYSTYLGGSKGDYAYGIGVDPSGNVYVAGSTPSSNFPTTPGAFQTTFGGGVWDAFVTELNPDGSALVYSTYLGGSSDDYGYGVAVDVTGNAYVAGYTSFGFPTTPGAFQTTLAGRTDAFVAKLATTPQAQVANLENTVQALVSAGTISPFLGQFLLAPLNAALAALGFGHAAAARPALDPGFATTALTAMRSGRTAAAIRDLDQFIFEVRLLEILRALTKAEGQILIDAAESIITALRV